MKKLLVLILSLSMVLALYACGEEKKPQNEVAEQPEIEQDVAVDTEIEDTEQPEKEDVIEPEASEKPSTTPSKPSTTPEKPSTTPNKPVTAPEKPQAPDNSQGVTTKPSEPQKSYSIDEVHKLIKAEYGEDYRANTEIPADAMHSLYGVDMSLVEQHIAEQPMISANIDTFIAIKAKEGSGAKIASSLEGYLSQLNSADACLYPSNIPKAQAGRVVRHGDYVFLVMLGAAGDIEADEQTQIAFAKEQVARGVNVINNYFAK